MFASLHLRDGKITDFFRRSAPSKSTTPGLVSVTRMSAAPFNGKFVGLPQLSRNGYFAVWESDDAITSYLESSSAVADDWHVRCVPLRAYGRWPGLPSDIARSVAPQTDGPVIGLTIGSVRPHRFLGFNAHNTRIERQLLDSDGVLWASGMFYPPSLLCSLSFWQDEGHLATFARNGAHNAGIEASYDKGVDPSLPDGTRYFAPDAAFMRLRPYRTEGALTGSNPIPESIFGSLAPIAD